MRVDNLLNAAQARFKTYPHRSMQNLSRSESWECVYVEVPPTLEANKVEDNEDKLNFSLITIGLIRIVAMASLKVTIHGDRNTGPISIDRVSPDSNLSNSQENDGIWADQREMHQKNHERDVKNRKSTTSENG